MNLRKAKDAEQGGSGAPPVTGAVTLAILRVGGATTAAFYPVQLDVQKYRMQ